ncbi:annexin D4 [Olea europaea subsp. europaea]|uniref:Annexin D4 n=1 Tax=Olea europaea subsp. europaea TaxID=158383 RepID=A0A8S0TTH0_OLEEU|nr:annexin D4 [Olea europaea subsp. europaea]
MAVSDELGALTRAFSGLGVDEKALISILGKWHPEQRQTYRKGTRDFFIEDERQFERWDDYHVIQLQHEFLRFKHAIVLWTMHPWERDARLLKEALHKGPQHKVLVEVACTRLSDELLGARKAYHSLFDQSVEEDVAFGIRGPERKLLVALVSSYRYEGTKVNEGIAKSEAKFLSSAIKGAAGNKNLLENEEVVRIVATRSKPHLTLVYNHYKEITGNYLDEDLEGELYLQETVQCLCKPQEYFSKVLDASMRPDVDELKKEAVTRIIVTRADVDMKLLKQEYNHKYGVSLPNKIEDVANGNYRDFLLTLVARGD